MEQQPLLDTPDREVIGTCAETGKEIRQGDQYVQYLRLYYHIEAEVVHHCRCGGYYHIADTDYNCRNYNCCPECVYEVTATCASCGNLDYTDNHYYHETSNQQLCTSCYDEQLDQEEEKTIDGLHAYDYSPALSFTDYAGVGSKSEYKRRYFGLELEIEAGNTSKKQSLVDMLLSSSLASKIYLKEDGSLTCGLEIITHPSMMKKIEWAKWRTLLESLIKKGYKSWEPETCGLHVHVSRNSLKADFALKSAYTFIKLRGYLMALSGRKGFSYCKFPEKIDDYLFSNERYLAINNSNYDTVEFRFFRGTLNYESFSNSIKFIGKIVEFIDSNSLTHLRQSTEKKLITELENSLENKTLNDWIQKRINKQCA